MLSLRAYSVHRKPPLTDPGYAPEKDPILADRTWQSTTAFLHTLVQLLATGFPTFTLTYGPHLLDRQHFWGYKLSRAHDALPTIIDLRARDYIMASGACSPHPPATWRIHIQPVNNCSSYAPELASSCLLPGYQQLHTNLCMHSVLYNYYT